MIEDTFIGGKQQRFPQTRWSAIAAAGSQKEEERRHAFESIVEAYWKPVYAYVRMKWQKSNEDAKDLTQGFFLQAIEKNYFQKYDPTKAHFRTFLRTCLDGYLANEDKAAKRIKRGGEAVFQSLDFNQAEGELKQAEVPAAESMEEYFEKEWVRSFFALAISKLRQCLAEQGKQVYFQLFERYDLGDSPQPTYRDLAGEFGLPATKVTNYLAAARREFRQIILEKLRELTVSEEEYRHEARALLGADL